MKLFLFRFIRFHRYEKSIDFLSAWLQCKGQAWGCSYFPLVILSNRLLYHCKEPSFLF